MPDYSTITVRAELKDRLSVLKGRKSWDEFMLEVLDTYPTEAVIQELEQRLADLRERKVQAVPWREVKAEMRSRRTKREGAQARRRRRA